MAFQLKSIMVCSDCGEPVMDGNRPRFDGSAWPTQCWNPDCPSNKPKDMCGMCGEPFKNNDERYSGWTFPIYGALGGFEWNIRGRVCSKCKNLINETFVDCICGRKG
jgi:hypothetical protein